MNKFWPQRCNSMKWYQVRSPFEEKIVSFVVLPEDGDNPILGLGKVSLGLRPHERRHPKLKDSVQPQSMAPKVSSFWHLKLSNLKMWHLFSPNYHSLINNTLRWLLTLKKKKNQKTITLCHTKTLFFSLLL